jgi:putative ABC transport system permease protein
MRAAALLIVGAGLRLFPHAFHREYARDMLADFDDRWREMRGARRIGLLVRTVFDVVASAISEHRRSSFNGSTNARAGRHAGEGSVMRQIARDLRHASRSLRAQPALSAFLALTVALGIGATTAVFSVVNAVLLQPLNLPDSGRLIAIWGRFDPESGFNYPRFPLSAPEFVDYRNESRALGDVAAWESTTVTVGGPGSEPARVRAARVSGNFFSLLRVSPASGRTFSTSEDRPGASTVALLSNGYWRSRFGGDTAVVGKTILMNGESVTIVGVMPSGFAYPGTATQIWLPLGIDPASSGNRKSHSLRAIGRLADGVSVEQAGAELRTIMAAWKARYPDIHTGHYLFIRPLLEDTVGTIRPALTALLIATVFVVLIVCANLAGVLMSRGEGRTREMSIRAALGASRAELVRLTLAEASILALIGGMLGVGFAWSGVRGLLALDPSSVPRSAEVTVDARVLAFGFVVAVATAALSGILPAMRGAAAATRGSLRESSHATTASGGRQRVRRTLVAMEVALGVVLVLGAGLTLRGFARLLSTDPGFEPAGLVTASVAPPERDYQAPEQVEAFYDAILNHLRAVPGVEAASASSDVPLLNDAGVWDFEIDGRPRPRPGEMAWNAAAVIARADLPRALGFPVKRGRFLQSTDNVHTMMVTAISESMAEKFFHGEDPVGRRIRVAGVTSPEAWMTIVGIVGDIRDVSLDAAARPTYYIAQPQVPKMGEGPSRQMSILMRISGSPDSAIAALRSAVHDVDPRLPLFDVEAMDSVLDRSVARPRFTTTLLLAFAVVGLLLGASGVYGVLAYSVATRTSEIGIRRALGAPASLIIRDILRGGLAPVAAGLASGIVVSFWTSRALATELFGVSSTDPATYLAATAIVLGIALLSCAVPARRALHISPLAALRTE